GSRPTSTSTAVCLLTSRRRAGSCYLIFSGGAVRISRPDTLTPPTIKLVTSTPSSPNWGSGKPSSLRTTPRAHRPSTGHWPTFAHGPVAHTKDPQAERVQTPGPDHFRRGRSFPEQRCRPDVSPVPSGLRTIPDPGCSTLRPTG